MPCGPSSVYRPQDVIADSPKFVNPTGATTVEGANVHALRSRDSEGADAHDLHTPKFHADFLLRRLRPAEQCFAPHWAEPTGRLASQLLSLSVYFMDGKTGGHARRRPLPRVSVSRGPANGHHADQAQSTLAARFADVSRSHRYEKGARGAGPLVNVSANRRGVDCTPGDHPTTTMCQAWNVPDDR